MLSLQCSRFCANLLTNHDKQMATGNRALRAKKRIKISIEPPDTQSPSLRRSVRAFVIPHTPRGTVPQFNNPNSSTRGAITLMA